VVFPAAAVAPVVKKTTAPPSAKPSATKTVKPTKAAKPVTTASAPAVAAEPEPAETTDPPQSLTPVAQESQVTLGHGLIVGALLLAFGFVAWAAIEKLRRGRRENR
jgi:hypothetical protein